MIYGTNTLYRHSRKVAVQQVVETVDGRVGKIYPFSAELPSMLWYDAIILSARQLDKRVFSSAEEMFGCVSAGDDVDCCYAYGINYEAGCCLFVPLK